MNSIDVHCAASLAHCSTYVRLNSNMCTAAMENSLFTGALYRAVMNTACDCALCTTAKWSIIEQQPCTLYNSYIIQHCTAGIWSIFVFLQQPYESSSYSCFLFNGHGRQPCEASLYTVQQICREVMHHSLGMLGCIVQQPCTADLNISHVNHPCKASLYTNTCTMCIVQCASSICLNMYTCMQIYVYITLNHLQSPSQSKKYDNPFIILWVGIIFTPYCT